MPFSELKLQAVKGGKWILLEPMRWHENKNKSYTVPKGFKTDLASIPRGFRWLVEGVDYTRRPAVLHDYLYRKGIGTKAEADRLFKKGLKEEGAPWWKVQACYYAVKFFGSGNFKD